METETYKKAKEILEKFDPGRFKEMQVTTQCIGHMIVMCIHSGAKRLKSGLVNLNPSTICLFLTLKINLKAENHDPK